MSQAPTTPPADDEIDLGRLFGLLIDHKWWIVGITALFATIGVVYALLATPVYRAETLVQIEDAAPSMNPLSDVTSMLGSEPPSQAEIEIIHSRMVLGKAVDLLNLELNVAPQRLTLVGDFLARRGVERPAFAEGWASVWAGEGISVSEMPMTDEMRGKVFELEVLDDARYALYAEGERIGEGRAGEQSSFAEGAVSLRVAEINAPAGARFDLSRTTRMQAFIGLRSRLTITEKGNETGILNWSLEGSDPASLKRILNTVADIYAAQNVRRQSEEARKSLEFLKGQVPNVRQELREAENSLNRYRSQQESVDVSLETKAVLERLVNLESQINELDFTESEISRRFTPSHPTYSALLEKKAQLERERAKLEERVNAMPETQQEILRLSRDVKVGQEIYVQLRNKVQEMEIAVASTVGNVRILDNAEVLPGTVAPKRPLIVVLATMLGGMLSVGLVLVRGLLRRGVEAPEQLEELGLNVYTTVPLSEEQSLLSRRIKRKQDKRGQSVSTDVLARRAPADLSIEALRGLRTSLHFAMLEAGDNRLVITGPSPGIGKSFVSSNLGAVCAQGGQRVLIVDADLRKGHVHTTFGGKSEGGLSELLTGKLELDAVLRDTGVEGLSYVSRGMAPPNPSELLMNAAFSDFLAQVSERFDLVIIDTPPVLAVTDPAIVASQCGTTLMVARFQVNPVKEMDIARQRLAASGVMVKGCVLNGMQRKAATSYGYGYYNYAYN
ncbi:polysaccharide biosynthesis tyrosine autokinase [Onishia taeanensis]